MIIVTGGSGKAGRACVEHLRAHGHEVVNVDRAAPAGDPGVPFVRAELGDFGQAIAALSSVDGRIRGGVAGVVHLAAIPAPGLATNAETFHNNTASTYNVFEACRVLGIKNIVWASSETVLGLPFDTPPPHVPLGPDAAPRPESAYALSKLLGETMAEQFCRWDPELKIVGLRLSNVMEPGDYDRFAGFEDDPAKRKWNLWGYIDGRDAAEAVRLALGAEFTGAEVFVIANADTVMRSGNAELLDAFFPGVPRRAGAGGNATLLSIEKARRLLGFDPGSRWRDPA
ncbi:NAD-dependent epimerase/dehydratase family protein [Phycisphaera mikurensis]|uniref:NAD-dependent epimerase/dehydratase family protein n=1 Tax=Phycisphaera mikurensis (strain NBRC 102666 / KCTC 22515 / FYK2301M01) TaxID=1142394 RepID=I0IEY3_PHYMF|nr:NAD(P)-dependent oxidoreductase [Phycisphaera mikurensis]MBB6441615.1 nucleoside-diphosphate-sugar epimerase [Phycisphaera mikurensis]BAM03821.1 NAD-dependent epimerase/dehydratase family protein [Phycisphaera mikurensis NBRC 102666]